MGARIAGARIADRRWETFAKISPYYAVSIYDRFQVANLDAATLRDFFKSGEEYIAPLIDSVKAHMAAAFSPTRVLDFGCGTGRLLIPLAQRFPEAVGVDISETMLAEARQNCRRMGVDNVQLIASDDSLSRVGGKFDFINSYIVFQHLNPKRGEALLKRMIDLLAEDGIAALHFTYHNPRSRIGALKYWFHASVPLAHNVMNLAKGRKFNHPYTLINEYDLNRLFRVLQQNGCQHSYLRFSDHGGLLGVILMFQKRAVGVV